jgi:hypothetical protein
MPGIFGSSNVRLAVLEEKLDVYEDLSREMLSKLETAVDKISEANQNVARILVRHEERLDQNAQSDMTIMKLIDEIKIQRKEDLEKTTTEINNVKKSINDLSRYRWIFAGVLLLSSWLISESEILSKAMSNETQSNQPRTERRYR